MKPKSITKNSIYFMFYNVLNVVFPLITGIYVARVLLPEYIGEVAYSQNIAAYFVILAFLGIPTYGMREIAKNRNNKDCVRKIHSELLIINTLSTTFFLLFYCALVFLVPSFRSYFYLYLIAGISIVLNYLNNSWLFQGLEEFKFIAVRNCVFKLVLLISLFVFVRKENDYIAYALVSSLSSAGAYIANIIYAKKRIGFDFHNLELKKHLKPIVFLVVVNLAIEIYTLVDTTMIGLFCDKTHVAFYTYGSRIYKVLLQIINTFTIVVVPRLSFYFKHNNKNEFNALTTKTFKTILLLAFPSIIGIAFVSGFLVTRIYGYPFEKSAAVIRILSLNLIISPIGYLLGSRMLLVSGREKKMIIAVGVGCIINIVLNCLFIPRFKEIGASIASIISEFFVAFIYIMLGKKVFKLEHLSSFFSKLLLSLALMTSFLLMIEFALEESWIKIIIQITGAVLIYFLCLMFTKERITIGLLLRAKSLLIKQNQSQ